MNKILIHSPYWDTGGGGERYSLSVAEGLQDICQVFVTVRNKQLLNKLARQLDLNLSDVNLFNEKLSLKNLAVFNGIFWVSDGSIPLLPVARRVIHFQAPFAGVFGGKFKNKIKLWRTKVVCNSFYTKKYIDAEFGADALVIYPPVETRKIFPAKKQNLVVTVGRFFTGSQNKRPDILIKAFKKMIDNGLRGWRLVIAGIIENEESRGLVSALRTMSRGYPIAIKTDLAHAGLVDLYKKARLYWHAAGYGMDLSRHPEKAEHFGISTVEAMAAGAVPLVFGAGGQLEIVEEGENGMIWSVPDDLVNKTLMLIDNSNQRKALAEKAIERSRFFGKERFFREIRELFNE